MQNFPKISIITPVYNGERFIEKTIISILSQNYPNLEYIIIDGGSTDQTLNIISKYKDKLAYFISEPDKCMYDALNKGFAKATGEILCWLNSDDEYYPHTLYAVAKLFSDCPDVEWVTGTNSHINEQGVIFSVQPQSFFNRISFLSRDYQWIQQESTFWRRTLMDRLNTVPFNIDYANAGDFYLWFQFSQFSNLYYTDIPLGKFRHSRNQISEKYIKAYHKEAISIIKSYKPSGKEKVEIFFEKIKRILLKTLNLLQIKTTFIDSHILHDYYLYKIEYDYKNDLFFHKHKQKKVTTQ